MHNSLFLLCPTDCLEATINRAFGHDNYFYTSLGNSFDSDRKTLDSIREVITKHDIRTISFVLASDNKIISDALNGQFFSEVRDLESFYREISIQKDRSHLSWQVGDGRFAMLSYYLNKRIKELRLQLYSSFSDSIDIQGRIYDREGQTFKEIYSDLICMDKYYLN